MTTIDLYEDLQRSLRERYDAGEAQSISRIVVEDVFDYRPQQRTHELSSEEEMLYRHIRHRLLKGEPVQYILGEADFYGLKFLVDRRVLIPRQETEELVHWVLESWKMAGSPAGYSILDVGTGSGCIPVSLKKFAPALMVSGLDVSPEALELAEENAQRHQTAVSWIELDILDEKRWDTLPAFDGIVSNPPYIPPSQQHLMPDHVLSYEPHLALFTPEHDPLIFYREIGLFAYRKLARQGQLFFETNEYKAAQVVALMQDIGFARVEIRKDLAGKDRMVKAVRA